ncbi:DUF2085 domain-containing protein [soil metagenome]
MYGHPDLRSTIFRDRRSDILQGEFLERGIGAEELVISGARPASRSGFADRIGWPAVFLTLVVSVFGLFTALPGTIEGKSLAVLHGLCAQQPTHSYYFGEARLPFDARMTGIYGGFALTCCFLLVRRRWRATGVREVSVVVALVLLVLPLAVDGANSLLKDLALPYLYGPRNVIRTMTGLMLGASLATFVWLLVGQTAFRPSSRSDEPVWRGLRELGLALLIGAGLVIAVGLGDLPVRVPLTYLLMASAVTVVTGLLLPFVLLVSRREQQAGDTRDLAGPAAFALLGAVVFIAGMSGGRFLLEALLGLPAQPLI